MTGYGRVKLKSLWDMLRTCASGYTKEKGIHKWIIKHKEKEYLDIGLGEHGKKEGQAEIDLGVIRALVRHFEIEECAHKELPILGKWKKKPAEQDSRNLRRPLPIRKK